MVISILFSEEDAFTKAPKINERSESFNEQHLTAQLSSESETSQATQKSEEPFNYRRESFNENCLRENRDESNERSSGSSNGTSDEAGSPFVSMPAIPAVYLASDGETQPLEKVLPSIN